MIDGGCWRGDGSWVRVRPVWGRSSAGRAPALQAGGRRFDPVRLHGSCRTGETQGDARCLYTVDWKEIGSIEPCTCRWAGLGLVVPGVLVFGNCESGSGALLGAQDNSVFSCRGGLWTAAVWGRAGGP